jgi:glyoxylase-like metal-dependent hydrolase (beta-lactamase superfamily II)
MREILPGIFIVPQNGGKGFGYAHFVERPAGNLVLDAVHISDSFDAIAERGGVAAVVLTDRHLAGDASNKIAAHFGARTYCSQIEADAMAHRSHPVQIDHALPYERTIVEGDVMLVPTPGHTEGQFATLCEVQGARILFTADFVWIEHGNWRPGNSSRKKMRKAFDGLRDLAFDYVVPWTSYSADAFFMKIDDVNATVDAMIAACPKP